MHLVENSGRANVPGMENLCHTLKLLDYGRAQQAVRIRENSQQRSMGVCRDQKVER